MPYTLSDGTQVPTLDDIIDVINFPDTPAAFTGNAIADLWNFLFGSGHAGSCGAFRDQYFYIHGLLAPVWPAAANDFNFGALNWDPIPTQVMADMGQVLSPVLQVADAQFDAYKGRNLLGQTMFASRTHLLLFREWAALAIFGTAQWAQFRINNHNQWLVNHEFALINHQQQIDQIKASVGQQGNVQQQFTRINETLGTVIQRLDTIEFQSLPTVITLANSISQRVSVLEALGLSQLAQRVTTLEQTRATIVQLDAQRFQLHSQITQVQQLMLTATGDLWQALNSWALGMQQITVVQSSQIASLIDSVNIQAGIERTLIQQVGDALRGVSDLNVLVIPSILDQVQANTQGIQQLQQQIGQVGQLQDLLTGLQSQVSQLDQALQTAQGQLRSELLQARNQLQGQIDTVQGALQEIGQLINQQVLQIIPQQLTNLQEQTSRLEQQKTDVILPALQQLGNAIGQIAQDIGERIDPALQDLQERQQQLQDQLTANIVPTITTLLTTVTNITNVITNTVEPAITNLQNFTNQFTTNVTNIIRADCQLVRECLETARDQAPDSTCEEGRKWWGTWAECWLNANTPVEQEGIELAAEDVDPLAAVYSLGSLDGEDPDDRMFQVLLETIRYLGQVQDDETDQLAPLVTADDASTFVFVEEPA